MKLTSRTDIDAPIGAVFAQLSDFHHWETAAREKDAEVERLDPATSAQQGHWRLSFPFRGRDRKAEARVVGFEPDQHIALRSESEGLTALVKIDLVEIDSSATRMHCIIDLGAGTIKARLLVQSLKLARTTIERRLQKRLKKFARSVERG